MKPTFKIIHDRQHCIGCHSCVNIAPQNWMMDEKSGQACLIGSQKKGKVWVGEAFSCDREANNQAAAACPMGIISLTSTHSARR